MNASSYALLAVSLGGIFAAGGSLGYVLGKRASPAPDRVEAMIGAANGTSPQQWADQAYQNLAGDLKLTDDQRLKIRPFLLTAAGQVFLERDRALLQMHLRLLEVHDTLAREASLDEEQKKRLLQSRVKLKASILARFADILGTIPGSLPPDL